MTSDLFFKAYGSPADLHIFSPGRVNLIGEHTDYNGGLVLPTALEIGLDIELTKREDNQVNIITNSFEGSAQRTLDQSASGHWSDYALGSIVYANQYGLHNGGADISVTSTLPDGAGLSSSAAITVGLLKLCRPHNAISPDDLSLAKIARELENNFIGVPCGIMDQVAVAISKPGEALKLDTQSLDYDIIALPDTHSMAVIHSGHYRQLSEGRYKERKEECDIIKQALGREDICKIEDEELETLTELPNHIYRRARHCATEHRRTLAASTALVNQDMEGFGRLMTLSHKSMKDDFEITINEIDKIVADALTFGALGARMTGGGFGGCIVACVDKKHESEWRHALLKANPKAFHVS